MLVLVCTYGMIPIVYTRHLHLICERMSIECLLGLADFIWSIFWKCVMSNGIVLLCISVCDENDD